MPSILNIGLSGLLTFQRALAVTSHNVSNANTEGYTRQRPDLQALAGQQFGNGYFGRGVEITDVRALSNRFVENRLTEAITDNGRTARFAELMARAQAVQTLQRKAPADKKAAAGAMTRRDAWFAQNADEALVVWDGDDGEIGKVVARLEAALGDDVWIVAPPG